MTLAIRYAARTDVGLVREGNEDSGLATDRLLVIADGMGGHAAGEVASAVTVRAMAEMRTGAGRDPRDVLGSAVRAANDSIRAAAMGRPEREGMGTTLTALLWTGEDLALAHIGDSRGYLLRDGELRQVTHDHTYVQALVDEGRLSAAEAATHPARSMLVRALGGQADPEPDLEMLHVRAGDRLLLCSDGLSDVVRPEAIRDGLADTRAPGAAAEALIELALAGGGPDNVTVIVVDVVESEGDDAPTSADAVVLGAAADPGGEEPDPSTQRVLVPPGDEDEELRYAPRPMGRYRWLRRAAFALVGVGVVVLAVWGVYRWTQQQYFVGADAGQVAIYRGLSQEVGSASVNSVAEVAEGLPVTALPEVYQEQLQDTISAADLADAHEVVARLREAACQAAVVDSRAARPTPSPTPSPNAAGATASPRPGVVRSAAPGGTPTPTTPAQTPAPAPTPTLVLPPGLDCTGTSVGQP